MKFTIEHEREEDGRWLAEVPELPGVLAYGATADEAMAKAELLALRVLAERLEHNEAKPQPNLYRDRGCMTSWPSSKARQVLPPSTELAGRSSANRAHTKLLPAPAGSMWSSHSTTAKKLVRECLPASRSAPD